MNTRRNGETERLGCLEVDYELETGRLLNRQIARLLALENSASIFAHHLKGLVSVRSVAHKAAGQGEFASKVHGGNRKLLRRRDDCSAAPLLQATHTLPIVFVNATDPVGFGLVESLARPGGNATGFMSIELSMGVKWLELLKQIAPSVKRAAVLRDSTQGAGTSLFA